MEADSSTSSTQHGCDVSLKELDCQVCHIELKLIVISKITNYATFNPVLEIFKYGFNFSTSYYSYLHITLTVYTITQYILLHMFTCYIVDVWTHSSIIVFTDFLLVISTHTVL